MKPRIWDTFILGPEADLDMMECHLTEMDDVTYRFIVSEAPHDHQGKTKPLYVAENWERFAPWHHKLVRVTADTSEVPPPPDRITYWDIENVQREAIKPHLADAQPDDWIIHGDVDEIPRPHMLEANVVLEAQHHVYALEWELRSSWRAQVCIRAADAPRTIRGFRNKMVELPIVDGGAWHLSWFGGIAACMLKFGTTAHGDIPDEARRDVASGRCVREGWHWSGKMPDPWHWECYAAKMHRYRGQDWPKFVLSDRCPPLWHRDAQLAELAGFTGNIPQPVF